MYLHIYLHLHTNRVYKHLTASNYTKLPISTYCLTPIHIYLQYIHPPAYTHVPTKCSYLSLRTNLHTPKFKYIHLPAHTYLHPLTHTYIYIYLSKSTYNHLHICKHHPTPVYTYQLTLTHTVLHLCTSTYTLRPAYNTESETEEMGNRTNITFFTHNHDNLA